MMHRHHLAIVLSLALSGSFIGLQVDAKSAAKKPTVKCGSYTDGGVKVTKNADGSVEVSDVGGSAADNYGSNAVLSNGSSSGESGGGTVQPTHTVIIRPAPPATIRYGDGVVVKRNADGSVEVTDEDSRYQQMQGPRHSSVGTRHSAKHSSVKRKIHH